MMKTRHLRLFLICMIIVIGCGACSQHIISRGNSNPGGFTGPDTFNYTDVDNAKMLVFNAKGTYIACDQGQDNWRMVYSGKPDWIKLSDGGFAYVDADVTLVSGGIGGIISQPIFNKIHSIKKATFSEVRANGDIRDFDPYDEYYRGPQVVENNGDTWYIIHPGYLSDYIQYDDHGYMHTYSSFYDAKEGMGLLIKKDRTATLDHYSGMNIYVVRCGDTYMAYCNNTDFSDLGVWNILLNPDFENKPLDFTLNDGEVAQLKDAGLYRVNGGDGNYNNAVMLETYDELEIIGYCELTYRNVATYWAQGAPTVSGGASDYNRGEYFIFNIAGEFYVYKRSGLHQVLIGVFSTEAEVDQAIGRTP